VLRAALPRLSDAGGDASDALDDRQRAAQRPEV
jgi:hypothetical protein